MKRSLAILMTLGMVLSSVAFGQTPDLKAEPVKQVSSFDKFYDRLSIGYFGVFTSPTLEDWDSRHGAISPEYSLSKKCHNCDTYPMSVWNQVNFGYNFGAKMKFNVIPRFTVFLDEAPNQDPGDRSTVTLEDALVGFSGVIYSSEDKRFNWWMRPGVRLPTSYFSRNYNNAAFGGISHQIDWANSFTFDMDKKWQFGYTLVNRVWIFEDRYNVSRHRIISNPWISYAIRDATKLQIWFEHFMETNKRWKSINGKSPVYKDVWQNLMLAVAHDVTPKLNVMPFLAMYVNDVPFSTKSAWIGAWISYQIK